MLVINCDGSCRGNPGIGGWGVWAMDKERDINVEFYGHSPETTNNQMELSAAIVAVKLIVGAEKAIIRTDSNYVIKGIEEWIKNWKKNGWKASTGKPVKNVDLWIQLDNLVQTRKIEWEWVKGHAGDVGNEKADQLANRGCDGEDNYEDFLNTVNAWQSGGFHRGKKNALTNGREVFIFQKEVKIYPAKKGYLMLDKNNEEIIFTQEEYDNLK